MKYSRFVSILYANLDFPVHGEFQLVLKGAKRGGPNDAVKVDHILLRIKR